MGDDLVVGLRDRGLTERAHLEKRDVVAPGHPDIEEHPAKMRWFYQLDVSLFEQLACQGRNERLSRLHPASGQMPAADVTVLDEKDPAAVIDDQRANAKRHGAGKAPIEMHEPSDCRLDPSPRSRKTHVHHSAPFAFRL